MILMALVSMVLLFGMPWLMENSTSKPPHPFHNLTNLENPQWTPS